MPGAVVIGSAPEIPRRTQYLIYAVERNGPGSAGGFSKGKLGDGGAEDRQPFSECPRETVQVPFHDPTPQVHRDGMAPLAVHSADDEVGPYFGMAGKSNRELVRGRKSTPFDAIERADEMTDRLGQARVRRFRQREPSSGVDLPVVDPREASDGASVQRAGAQS
jgi:hypothetical protein